MPSQPHRHAERVTSRPPKNPAEPSRSSAELTATAPGAITSLQVALVSFVVLAFEVSLTRVYSILFSYHYVFLAVSSAACGLGLGGFAAARLRVSAPKLAVALALSLPASMLLLFANPLSPQLSAGVFGVLLPLFPFTFGGAYLARRFEEHASHSGKLYGADLVGAGVAAALIVPLLSVCDALHLPFLLGAIAAGVAILDGPARLRVVSGAIAAVCLVLWPISARRQWLSLSAPKAGACQMAKPMLADLAAKHGTIIDTEWSAYARTDLVRFDGIMREQIFTDGDTPAGMEPFNGDLSSITHVDELPYFAFAVGPRGSMLSIGPGGGLDFLLGEMTGFHKLEGVELNPSTVRMVERHRDFNGGVYHLPGVHVVVDDGRGFVRRSQEQYDLIVNALTLTNTAANNGAALVESYIYTREAFADYFHHLTPEGRYALVAQSPNLVLRAAETALAVMRGEGMSDAEAKRHLLILTLADESSTAFRNLLVWKRSALSAADLAATSQFVASGIARQVELPAGPPPGLDLTPVTDDRPFFLYLGTGVPRLLMFLLLGAGGLAALCIGASARRGRGRATGYFSVLGAAFMLVEIPLTQKLILFLGHPTESLAVVLFCVLVGAGLGSQTSQRWPVETLRRRVAAVGKGIALSVAVLALALTPLLDSLLALPQLARWVVAAILLMPLGFALGLPFPSGLRLVKHDVAIFWGVNGVTSVAGSALAAVLSYRFGFTGCLVVAAALYASIGFWVPRAQANSRA